MLAEERVQREVRQQLAHIGMRAGISVRDLDTGRHVALDPDLQFPLASVAKFPLVAAVLQQADSEAPEVALDEMIHVTDATRSEGPTGLSRFRHRAQIAIEDLLYLALNLSDNTASDLLFTRFSPAQVTAFLRERGHQDITIRHLMRDLNDSLSARFGPDEQHLALSLAARAATGDGGSLVPQLDTAHANTGSARALTALLADVWNDKSDWAASLRALLSGNMHRHRLAPDLESDAAKWSSKTGTFLTLRHEVGVLEHDDGRRFAVAVLSESRVAARVQPAAEAALGAAAQRMVNVLDGADA